MVFQVVNMNKTDINITSHDAGFVFAPVNTGKVDLCTQIACFIEIHPAGIETTKVIDHTYHKFQWKMGFEIKALIAFHCIGSRMSLGKGITGKGFDLSPHFLGNFFRITGIPAVLEKFIDNALQFLL